MAVIINASTSTGLVQSADTSGIIQFQSNGSTKATINSSGFSYPSGVVQVVHGVQGSQVSLVNSGGQSSLYGLPTNRLYGDLVSISITPKSASNTLLFMGHCGMTSGNMSGGCGWGLTLVKNNTTGYDLGDYDWYSPSSIWAGAAGAYPPNQHYQYIVNAGSTSSQTWYLKAYNYSEGNSHTVNFRNGTFIILEVSA